MSEEKYESKSTQRRAFGYLRYSRIDRNYGLNESTSIGTQRNAIKQYCANNGIVYAGEYVDDGKSGESFDRDGFQQMIMQLKEKKADTVITTTLARLGRPVDWTDILFDLFPENGVRYIACEEGIDSSHYDERLPILTGMNSSYLLNGSRRVRDALATRRNAGIYCSASPFGYKRNPNDVHHLIPDEETASIVRRIFELAATGASSHSIAVILTEEKVPTPSLSKELKRTKATSGNSRITTHWSTKEVKRILSNEVYLGHTILGKSRSSQPFTKHKKKDQLPRSEWTFIKNTHPAIIDEELFHTANKNKAHVAFTSNAESSSKPMMRQSIFNGITYCGLCGSAMDLKRPSANSPENQWQLDCNRHRNDIENPCCGAPIYYESLKAAVLAYLADATALTDEDLDSIVTTALSNEDTCNAILSEMKHLETTIVFNEAKIDKLYDDNLNGLLSDGQHERAVRGCQSAISDAQTRIDALQQELATINSSDNTDERERLMALAKQLSRIETLDRDTLLAYVDRIEVLPRELPPGLKKLTHPDKHDFSQQIEIYLKFAAEMQ